jgi:N6-adenosine-specific RNA methylase IME4/ParB-like chromosome segregation protein Spo0J
MLVAGYETHPAANIFPLLDGAELDALAEDIRAHGQRNPVIVIGTKVLDGRNRLLACARLGIEARFKQYVGDDPVAFVLSENLHRRHLNESQRAMVAAKIATLGHGGDRRSIKSPIGDLKQADAAATLNVGKRSVERAKDVIEKAAPEVVAAVERGELAVSAAAELTKLPEEKQRAVLARSNGKPGNVRALVKQVEKAEVAKRLEAEPPALPAGPFRVIVSDPPWQYDKRAGDVTHRGDLPYPSMTTDAICALDVGSRAHPEGCVLWLWTTNAFMRDAFRVLDAWGFQEKTILTWVKNRIGLGDWLRGQTEHCILAVRGSPTITLTNQTTKLEAVAREHSRKPDEFYALVEALCPGSKVEMFCRTPREGWAAWGAETTKFAEAAR